MQACLEDFSERIVKRYFRNTKDQLLVDKALDKLDSYVVEVFVQGNFTAVLLTQHYSSNVLKFIGISKRRPLQINKTKYKYFVETKVYGDPYDSIIGQTIAHARAIKEFLMYHYPNVETKS